MRKKLIKIGIICIFLFVSGVCYSCAYQKKDASVLVATDMNTRVTTDAASNASISITATKTGVTTNPNNIDNSITTSESILQTDSTEGSAAMADNTTTVISGTQPSSANSYIYVHICGAVVTPGVYRAKEGARLVDFILMAGGLTKDAAGDYMNQAQLLTDGQRIYIPDKEELKDLSLQEYLTGDQNNTISDSNAQVVTDNKDIDSSLININTADKEELMSISGIGEAKAASILAYREKNGKFNSIEELMSIPGIKEGLFNQISYMIVAK